MSDVVPTPPVMSHAMSHVMSHATLRESSGAMRHAMRWWRAVTEAAAWARDAYEHVGEHVWADREARGGGGGRGGVATHGAMWT